MYAKLNGGKNTIVGIACWLIMTMEIGKDKGAIIGI